MKTPTTNKEWADEVFEAYNHASKLLENGLLPVDGKYNLFRYAPILAANNREIDKDNKKIDMLEFTVKDIERDFSLDENSQQHFLFHFIMSYIHSHVYANIITELEADAIMDYINDNYQLFNNA